MLVLSSAGVLVGCGEKYDTTIGNETEAVPTEEPTDTTAQDTAIPTH